MLQTQHQPKLRDHYHFEPACKKANYHNHFLLAGPTRVSEDVFFGYISGFHFCCILYYLIRNKIWDRYPKYRDKQVKLIQIKWHYEHDILKRPRVWHHVGCPVHELLYKLKLYKPEYNHCDCGWTELK